MVRRLQIIQTEAGNATIRSNIVSITMTIVAPNGGVPSLSMDYLQAPRHELRFSRVPFLFLILQLFLINNFPIKLHVCMRQV